MVYIVASVNRIKMEYNLMYWITKGFKEVVRIASIMVHINFANMSSTRDNILQLNKSMLTQ